MISHQSNGIIKIIEEVIPGSVVTMKVKRLEKGMYPEGRRVKGYTEKFSGINLENNDIEFWFEDNNNVFYLFDIKRENVPLSKNEKRIISTLPQAIRSFHVNATNKTEYIHQSISCQFSLPYLWITQLLRGSNPSRCWTTILAINLLQQLTFEKYEGNNCASGFVCIKDYESYMEGFKNQEIYSFTKFKTPIILDINFFNKPASYRYVDGKNSFYLIDKSRIVYGVIRNNHPENFTIIDRCVGNHIRMLKKIPYFRWMAYIGLNNDINIFCRHDILIKNVKNKWQLREKSLVYNEIIKVGAEDIFAQNLCDIIFTLSELRMGSLILIQEKDESPTTMGKIDSSKLGNELYSSMYNMIFSELIDSNSILGVLSSDGLSTFNKKGYIIDCGSIIDLSNNEKTSIMGGGRSQAAISASYYGLAIKVSEDGPISLYYKGNEIIKI